MTPAWNAPRGECTSCLRRLALCLGSGFVRVHRREAPVPGTTRTVLLEHCPGSGKPPKAGTTTSGVNVGRGLPGRAYRVRTD